MNEVLLGRCVRRAELEVAPLPTGIRGRIHASGMDAVVKAGLLVCKDTSTLRWRKHGSPHKLVSSPCAGVIMRRRLSMYLKQSPDMSSRVSVDTIEMGSIIRVEILTITR